MIGRDIEVEEQRLRNSLARTNGQSLAAALASEEAEKMPRLQMKSELSLASRSREGL